MQQFSSISQSSEPLSDAVVIAILTADLPYMNTAQLAELLTNLYFAPSSAIGAAVIPLARRELARLRDIERAWCSPDDQA